MKINKEFFLGKKSRHEPIVMITAYDYPSALIEEEAGVDIVLVGDSVGTNVLGYKSEAEVTVADMVHHCRAVSRGIKNAYLMVDMPFGSADDPFKAFENARPLLDAGANCIKIEGWAQNKQVIEYLTSKGIDVCGHIGYNPQFHGPKAKVFGKEEAQARELIQSAQVIETAGAMMIVVEKVPAELTALIAKKCNIPIIGIGSGNQCDGQVLVVNDILGYGEKTFKHAKKYMDFKTMASSALKNYCQEVRSRTFPSEENSAHVDESEVQKILKDSI
jgi:3-methyl-2-oxobutanoate hydroxymethyltransferase